MKGLKSKIVTTVLDETGIRLHPKDFHFITEDHMLILKLWSTELIRKKFQSEKSLESDEFAEDLLNELFDEYKDLREKIIEVKKEDLSNTYIEEIKGKVNTFLKSKKISAGIIDGLEFEVTESNSKNRNDHDWGYPVIGIRITNYESIDYFYPLDVNKDPLVVDENVLCEELLNKIRK